MWFIILLVLALAAFFIVKAVKAQALRKQAEQERLAEGSGLAGTLSHEAHDGNSAMPAADTASAQSPGSTVASGTAAAVGAAGAAAAGHAAGSSGATAKADAHIAATEFNSGDPLRDIQEMIKVLNLAEPDAGRLAISREEFQAIRQGNEANLPSSDSLAAVADKLQRMLS